LVGLAPEKLWKLWAKNSLDFFSANTRNLDLVHLAQACTTYGPPAKLGPWKLLIWFAKVLLILLLYFIKTPFECAKISILALGYVSNYGPAMRFELCMPWIWKIIYCRDGHTADSGPHKALFLVLAALGPFFVFWKNIALIK